MDIEISVCTYYMNAVSSETAIGACIFGMTIHSQISDAIHHWRLPVLPLLHALVPNP